MKSRQWIRAIHLVGAACLGTLVYSPWIANETFVLFNQVVVVPALTITGLWMWLGHRLRSAGKKRSSQALG